MKKGWAIACLTTMMVMASVPAMAQDSLLAGDEAPIASKTLPNGLEVYVIEDHSVPLVTVEIAVKNGAFTEPPEFNGLSHLYEHMFFKGNAVLPTQEAYLARIRELGISFNGTTSSERVNYYFTLGSDLADEGVEFMANAILTPRFNEKELVKAREVVIGEFDRNEANPGFHMYKALEQKLFWKYPTRKDSLGDRKTILGATVDQMKVMQKKYYLPNNSTLIIAGDISPEEGFKLAEKYLGKWEKGPDPFKIDPIPAHPPIKKIEAVVVEKKVSAVTIMMGWHGPSVSKDEKSTYAADVLSFILGQRNSRFQKNLVDSGLALYAGIGYQTLDKTGPIMVTLRTTPGKTVEAIKAVQAELGKLTDPNYFTDEQIQTAKTLLAVDNIHSREKTSDFAHTVSYWWAVSGVDYYTNYIKNLNAVTRQDMAQYVKKYVFGKKYVASVLASKESLDSAKLSQKTIQKALKPVKRVKVKADKKAKPAKKTKPAKKSK